MSNVIIPAEGFQVNFCELFLQNSAETSLRITAELPVCRGCLPQRLDSPLHAPVVLGLHWPPELSAEPVLLSGHIQSATAERAVLAALDGSCRTPISAMADLDTTGRLSLSAAVLSADGQQKFAADAEGSREQAQQIGTELGQRLLQMCGGKAFLA